MFDYQCEWIRSFKDYYSFLSNFYQSKFMIDDITFPTVEHFYQFKKTHNYDDALSLLKIDNPGKVKRISRSLPMRHDWDNIKRFVMATGVYEKFSQNLDLRNKLISTYPAYLLEGNTWHDNYWGHCSCDKCINKNHYNILGTILMSVRKELKDNNYEDNKR